MKTKIKIGIMIALLFAGMIGSTGMGKTAEAASGFSNLEIGEGGITEVVLVPGKVTEVTIPIEAKQDFIYGATFEAIIPEGAPFQVEGFDIYQQHLSMRFEDDYISTSSGTMLTFYILTKETAKIGEYEFDLRYEDRTWDGTIIREGDREYSQRVTMTARVEEEKMPAELAINNLKVSGTMKPGGEATVTFEVVNTGEIMAKGVRLSGDYSSGMLIPNYTEYTRKLGDLMQNQSAKVSLKIKVMENVTQSIVLLPLKITYKDSDGESFTADANNILYLNVQLPEDEKKEEVYEDGTLLINNVKQSPSKPKAGEKVTLTFDMQNTGERDYTDVKLYMDYVSNIGFEPVNAEPYQFVGTVKAGQKKTVSVTVIAGKEIPDGMNTLGIGYTYKNGRKEEVSGNVQLYVLNVQAKKEEEVVPSRPKLMVTDFSVDRDVVIAGEEFDFTFLVYNTHNETAAKNIKVTVVSDLFSVTKGSNSFFIQKIAPEESEELVINLKASAAAMTGSYPINIQMEYEYDGMPSSEANAGGVSVTETKMLLVKENLRVSVENVMVGGWDVPYANQTTQLSFSVYNMGKSALNNVYFTVEGDFMVANGSSYYYGTLQAGYPDYVEMDIIPLVSGEAVGTLTIHMEDSNGDEETYTCDISGYIMDMESMNMGYEDPGMDWPTDLPTMGEPVEEKPMLVPLPVYIGILVVLFLLSLFITRGIRLACYKKKLQREQE